MPYIDFDISHFSIFRAPLGLLEMSYIDLVYRTSQVLEHPYP